MQYGWRIMVNQDASPFMRDVVAINVAYRDADGLRILKPFTLELGDIVAPEAVELPLTPTEIPHDAAVTLLEALGHALLGKGDMVREIKMLRQQLHKAETRLDNLINGIGRLGKGGASDVSA